MFPEEPEIVTQAKSRASEQLKQRGHLMEPLLFFRKDGEIQEPLFIYVPRGLIIGEDIRDQVKRNFHDTLYQIMPKEVVIVYEGFMGYPYSDHRFMIAIFSVFHKDRTWVAPIQDNQIGLWSEIRVRSGDLYRVFDRVAAEWN
jgi:hypothetical protein